MDEPMRDDSEVRVIVDTGECRVETHPEYGVIVKGAMTGAEVDGEGVLVPAWPEHWVA